MQRQPTILNARVRLLLASSACLLLAACGSGGGTGGSAGSAPTLNAAASSPGLEIGVTVPVSGTNNATGYAIYNGATSYYLPAGTGGNPDGLISVNDNSSSGRLDVSVTNAQVPGIYRLAVNAKDSSGNNAGNLFNVLVYPFGQANSSSGYSANLSNATEVTFANSVGSPDTGTITLPPRLNISYPSNEYVPSSISFGQPGSLPAVTATLLPLSNKGITINSKSVDGSNRLVLNVTIDHSHFSTDTDPSSTSPSSGGFLLQMNADVFQNGQSPSPYMEVFYVTPNVAP